MKFAIVAVFCLIAAPAFAYPAYDDFEETQEFESAVAEATENEEGARVERNTYGHGGHHHVQPVHHQVHAYAAHPPKVECGSNLLVGCHPTVAKVRDRNLSLQDKKLIFFLILTKNRSHATPPIITGMDITHPPQPITHPPTKATLTDTKPQLMPTPWELKPRNGKFTFKRET